MNGVNADEVLVKNNKKKPTCRGWGTCAVNTKSLALPSEQQQHLARVPPDLAALRPLVGRRREKEKKKEITLSVDPEVRESFGAGSPKGRPRRWRLVKVTCYRDLQTPVQSKQGGDK